MMGAYEVAFLGDFYHVRGLMPVRLQNAISDELDRWAVDGLVMLMLPGNHDQVDVQGRHALEVFRSHPAVTLYEKPAIDRWGLWIPYMHDLDLVRQWIKHGLSRLLAAGQEPVLFWHGAMLGAAMNDKRLADRGLDAAELEGFKLACLGHFHMRQKFGVAHYIGSPWETRADEAGQPKGFAVLRDGALTFHDRVWGGRHVSTTGNDAASVIATLVNTGINDVVRVSVPESEVESVSKALAGRFKDYSVTPIRALSTSTRELPSRPMSIREHAERYVTERAGELDRGALSRGLRGHDCAGGLDATVSHIQ